MVVLKDLLIAEQVIGRRNTTHILAAHVKVKVLYRALHIKLERNVCYLFIEPLKWRRRYNVDQLICVNKLR